MSTVSCFGESWGSPWGLCVERGWKGLPLKILLVASPPFEEIGGVSTHVRMLSGGLQALGETVHVIGEQPPRIYRAPLVSLPGLLLYKTSRRLGRRWDLATRHLYYLVKGFLATGFSPDVINVQDATHMPMAVHLKRLTGCQVVLTVHGFLADEAEESGTCVRGDALWTWLRDLETRGYRDADQIIAVSSSAAAYVDEFAHAPISVIHSGIDTLMFSPCPAGAYRRSQVESGLRLLFAGFLEPHKGVLDAVEVLVRLREAGISAELIVAGEGSEREPGRHMAEQRNIADHISWLGAVKKSDMPAFYRMGEVLLMPSKPRGSGGGEEPFPYTALEAMASGLPVIAYDVGGLSEQIKDGSTGFIVPLGDIRAMVTASETLVDLEIRRGMSAMARERIESDFSALGMARKFVSVYNQ